jgi:DNA polymerase III alpha subunit
LFQGALEAYGLVRRLIQLYPNRLCLELAFHGNAAEKLVHCGLIAIAQWMKLPLVATNAVRFLRPDDALAHKGSRSGRPRCDHRRMVGHDSRDGLDPQIFEPLDCLERSTIQVAGNPLCVT